MEDVVEVFFNYVRAHSAAQLKLRCGNPTLHPIYSYFVTEIRDLRQYLRQATKIFSPVLSRTRSRIAKDDLEDNNPITWLLREVSPQQYADDEYLTNILLAYGITFVFSPSPIGTQLIYKMSFRPDYCAQLQDEASQVFGHVHTYDKNTLRQLTMLDSFCKETHRHHPSAACKPQTVDQLSVGETSFTYAIQQI